ncbi:hypothetical protein [Desulfurobacterium sp.]
MEKGFRDIEEYFLSVAENSKKTVQQKISKPQKKVDLHRKIRNLNEKLRGKDAKIRQLYAEISQLSKKVEDLEKENRELSRFKEDKAIIENYKQQIENLKEEIACLKSEIAEKDKKIKSYESSELPKSRVELFIEVALNSIATNITVKRGMRVLFSKRFRKDIAKEVACRPFLFESFMSALSRCETTSKLLKRNKQDIYRIRITSPYGEFRAIYTKLDKETIKFHRFGQRDDIYKELDASGWSLD